MQQEITQMNAYLNIVVEEKLFPNLKIIEIIGKCLFLFSLQFQESSPTNTLFSSSRVVSAQFHYFLNWNPNNWIRLY